MEKVFSAAMKLESYLMEGFWVESGDPRVGKLQLFLMTSFRLPLAFLLLYLFAVYIFAPILARNQTDQKQTHPLKPCLHLYNVALIILNGYIVVHCALHYQSFSSSIIDVKSPSANYLDTSPPTLALLKLLYLCLLSRYAHLPKTVIAIARGRPKSSSHIYGKASLATFGWIFYRCCGSVMPLLAAITALMPLYDTAYHLYALFSDLQPLLKYNFTLKLMLMKWQLVTWTLLGAHFFYFALMQTVYCLQVASAANLLLYGANVAAYLTLFAYDFFMPNL